MTHGRLTRKQAGKIKSWIKGKKTAREVGEAVALMCAENPKLNSRLISTEKFIRVILPFLTGVSKGKGIDNLRLNIDDAWTAYKKTSGKNQSLDKRQSILG